LHPDDIPGVEKVRNIFAGPLKSSPPEMLRRLEKGVSIKEEIASSVLPQTRGERYTEI